MLYIDLGLKPWTVHLSWSTRRRRALLYCILWWFWWFGQIWQDVFIQSEWHREGACWINTSGWRNCFVPAMECSSGERYFASHAGTVRDGDGEPGPPHYGLLCFQPFILVVRVTALKDHFRLFICICSGPWWLYGLMVACVYNNQVVSPGGCLCCLLYIPLTWRHKALWLTTSPPFIVIALLQELLIFEGFSHLLIFSCSVSSIINPKYLNRVNWAEVKG